jgi:perosamine synthetase
MEKKGDSPAASGTPPEFVQTAKQLSEMDRWHQITEAEVRIAQEMTQRNELSGGTPVVREFEREWREWIGTEYALTTMNGTSALYSGFFGIGVGPGDEVICPTYTWICTIAPALLLGAKPVFCESDPETILMDPADVRRRITPNTRAIVPVHLWGYVCDMDAIMAISRETGIPIVEDCSHAHGARYDGRMCGSIGDVGCWSLQGSKAVSAGEGGVLATDDVECFERACLVGQVNRIKGVDLVTSKYAELQPLGLGMKFRAHPLGIGIAKVQLKRLSELNSKRRAYVEAIETGLENIPAVKPVKQIDKAERAGFYGFPIRYFPEAAANLSTDSVAKALSMEGVPTQTVPYPLLHQLPLFQRGFDIFTRGRGPLCEGYEGYRDGDFPVTEKMHAHLLFLPVLSDAVPGAAERIVTAIRKVVESADKLVQTEGFFTEEEAPRKGPSAEMLGVEGF